MPAAPTRPEPDAAITAVPTSSPAMAPASTRSGPSPCATPRRIRPTKMAAQYAETSSPAMRCGTSRPALRKTYPPQGDPGLEARLDGDDQQADHDRDGERPARRQHGGWGRRVSRQVPPPGGAPPQAHG